MRSFLALLLAVGVGVALGVPACDEPTKEPVRPKEPLLPAQLVSSADEPTKEPLRPATEVLAAWQKAGAEFLWVSSTQWGFLAWRSGKEKPMGGAVPAFGVALLPPGKLKVLPPPEIPFGLRFGPQLTDAGLKALAGLTQLQLLDLRNSQVTDAGLKELAGLTQLQSLDLVATQVTDVGLKELAGLTQLQSLDLWITKVTDAGVQELQKALPQVSISR